MMSIIVAELTRRIADSLILPFNLNTYAQALQEEYDSFERKYISDLDKLNITLESLKYSVRNFTHVAESFHKRLDLADKTKLDIKNRLPLNIILLKFL